jgi:ABC-2 type transport system ATP-binding protein
VAQRKGQRRVEPAAAPEPAAAVDIAKPVDPDAGALLAEGLSKAYGELVALAPLDLRIGAGERVMLCGHNGSGKSTFLRLCAGLLEASEGIVTIAGHEAGSLSARAAVSYLPDLPVFYDDLSLGEHIEFVSRMFGTPDWVDRGAGLLDVLGLLDRTDDLPTRYSRGLQQRASILLGLVRPFAVLLVDEPFVGLDAPGRRALLGLLDEATDSGATVVVATHQPEFAERTPRVVALRDGELVHDGPATPAEVERIAGA